MSRPVPALTLRSLAFGLVLLPACGLMQGLNPETRLSDQVYQLNDEARWGRVDLAAMRVSHDYRVAFVRSHARWGHDVRVADADVTSLTMSEPDGSSSSLVTYSWVDERTMELYATTVRQRWIGEGDGFRLGGEEIIAGEARLFDVVEGGPTMVEGADALAASTDEGGLATSGDELPESSEAPTARASGITVRRDAQGLRIN